MHVSLADLEVELDAFPTTRDVWYKFRGLCECKDLRIAVGKLGKKVDGIMEIRKDEFLQGLPLVCLRWALTVIASVEKPEIWTLCAQFPTR